MAKLTPMMQQYFDIKKQYKDCILFFRLGDFYEMFFDDAKLASKILEITLTGRDCGQKERAPMCGVPYHSADSYIKKLIETGHKVAICEQVEDPSKAKGIVKRDVIRVITPGTVTDSSTLNEKVNNFLACICKKDKMLGASFVDVSTGELYATQLEGKDSSLKLINEFARFCPAEVITNKEMIEDKASIAKIRQRFNCGIEYFSDLSFDELNTAVKKITSHFKILSLTATGLEGKDLAVKSVGALLEYLEQTQKVNLNHISSVNCYSEKEYMDIDIYTRRNLELTETMREKKRVGSLIWVLDKTQTAMGARLLKKWIDKPLLNCVQINKRLFAVDELVNDIVKREELREFMKNVYDIERLLSKIIYTTANGRDLIALKKSLVFLPQIKSTLKQCSSALLRKAYDELDVLSDVKDLIEKGIEDDPPFSIREGGIIKKGYDENIDKLRSASIEGKKWIANLRNEERNKTGIKNLKVGFNKVFGYFIEVTKSNLSNVPERYIRKQTLANCERYITPELKEIENTILGSEEKSVQMEYDVFVKIRDSVGMQVNRIQKTAKVIATIDVLCSLAETAHKNNYCMPKVNVSDKIIIKEGRHPVVEKMIENNMFVPNDTLLDNDDNRLAIITGPNMAGKSTYMRQTALIVLMAQIGSFVPASFVEMGIVDKIFTRVGASDDLASGQSTFMVEMSEVANILNNATSKSLLILDEIGRGTSTYDGLSIAWSVIEYVSSKKKLGAKTLFATHYHELTELENKLGGIKNYCIAVKKHGDDITFLRKVVRGGADDSYGIEVAKLAGVPDKVTDRAKQILKKLEKGSTKKHIPKNNKDNETKNNTENQIDIVNLKTNEIIETLKKIDISTTTPIEALNVLYKLQKEINI